MRINDSHVLPAFFPQALCDENPTVFGDGMQMHSFCFDGLVEAFAACRSVTTVCH